LANATIRPDDQQPNMQVNTFDDSLNAIMVLLDPGFQLIILLFARHDHLTSRAPIGKSE
jgi:hypothetical protein